MFWLDSEFFKRHFYRGETMIYQQEVLQVKATKKRVSDKALVQAYVGCKSYEELAAKLALTEASVRTRCSKLRKAGVNLKPYDKATRRALDVDSLNAIVAGQL
jgi:biotin operon repressor